MNTRTTGMLLGKFMPPHRGHQHLVETALEKVDELTVLVCSLPTEPIPGDLRHAWMREMFPTARVIHVTDIVPQEPAEHPDFWTIWHDLIRRHLPTGPDFVFASENYGQTLADVLGAKFFAVDIARETYPVSGTMVRNDPRAHWDMIPDVVRPYFSS